MRKKLLTIIACLAVCLCSMAQFYEGYQPAFPGAEGWARYTTGGRYKSGAGVLYHVTTLEDGTQAGTLRYALTASGRRTVVFDVAGTIHLKSDLRISNDNLTILGQTAPGDGICIADYPVSVSASNVIIRYMRFRMGDVGSKAKHDADPSYEGDDALGGIANKSNIIIDHCSVSWSTDECCSFYKNTNFTLQWCVISESLKQSVHAKGSHGYGGIWGGTNASFHHNLIAHHDSRNPRFDHDYVSTMKGPVDYVNNVLYNWGGNSSYGGESSNGEAKYINMVNNYYKPGPASTCKTRLLNPTTTCSNCLGVSTSKGSITPGKMYINGNYMYGSPEVTADNLCDAAIDPDASMSYDDWRSTCVASEREGSSDYDFDNYNVISLHSAENAYEKVRRYAGASFSRDNIDKRIAYELKTGTYHYLGSNGSTNGMIDSQTDVGGWPELTGTTRTIGTTGSDDSDSDGIPDSWEKEHGLTVGVDNSKTFNLDKNHKYYTDLEVYANYLVQEITQHERENAGESFEEYYPLGAISPLSPEVEPEDPVLPIVPTTEVLNASKATTEKGVAIAGTCYTLNANANPSGSTGEYIKLRTNQDNNTWVFTVNSGYTIKGISIKAYSNNSAESATIGVMSVTVDGTDQTIPSSFTGFPVTAANATTLTCSNFEAKNNITVTFDNSNIDTSSSDHKNAQVFAIVTFTYEKQGTGIEEVKTSVVKVQDNFYYNLSGQRVSSSTKGILIHNGKKVIRN